MLQPSPFLLPCVLLPRCSPITVSAPYLPVCQLEPYHVDYPLWASIPQPNSAIKSFSETGVSLFFFLLVFLPPSNALWSLRFAAAASAIALISARRHLAFKWACNCFVGE